MAEQTSTTNRPPLFKVTRGATLKGSQVELLGTPDDKYGFRSITEAQREVFALHEIAQTIGSSLNMNDTVTLISNKLHAIVPFDTCIIYIVDDRSGKAMAIHVVGDHAAYSAGGASILEMGSAVG